MRKTRIVTAALLAGAALLVAPAAAKRPHKAPRKPDLVVTSARIENPAAGYVFANEGFRFVWTDTTKNIGRAPAGRSKTWFAISENRAKGGKGGTNIKLGDRKVPSLKAGEPSKATAESARTALPLNLIGLYYPYACADRLPRHIDESNESNNCRGLLDYFSILPRRWTGTVTGSGFPYPGVTESWTGTVTWVFDSEVVPHGAEFRYKVESADLRYTTSGTDPDGCAYSGTSPDLIYVNKGESENNSLRLLMTQHTYVGFAMLPPGLGYPVTVSCPGTDPSTETFPFQSDVNWFNTLSVRPFGAKVGFTHLHGAQASPVAPLQYIWTFDAG